MVAGQLGVRGLIDQLVQVRLTSTTPVVAVVGCGGSGRTASLEQLEKKWKERTPTAFVRPHEIGGDEGVTVRQVLAAIMLELSVGAEGYEVAFPRLVLALLVMRELDVDTETDPERAKEAVRILINSYRDRFTLIKVLRALLEEAGVLAADAAVPGAATFAPVVANGIAEAIVGRLQRSYRLARYTWTDPVLAWFSGQGRRTRTEPELRLWRLAVQARSEDEDVRRDVDDLLVAALLADLRESVANTANRPANALALLDDGDTPGMAAFLRALVRVRTAIAEDHGNPESERTDALTVVVTSGGALADELSREQPASAQLDEAELGGPLPEIGGWWRVSLADLAPRHVVQLAKGYSWPAHVGTASIAEPLHRLTRGHPKSTAFLLCRLQREERLVSPLDLDGLLRGAGPEPDVLVEDHLLMPFVKALDAEKVADENTLHGLITLSAARDRREANLLKDLVPETIAVDSPLFTSSTLWTCERLHFLVRYLGMRALARRKDEDRANWTSVFETLRAGTTLAGQLHHERMLGRRDEVAGQLAGLLRERDSEQWLALFDEVTATPDVRDRDAGVIRRAHFPAITTGHIARLLRVIPAVDHDPCVTGREQRKPLRLLAYYSYLQLAGADGVSDPLPFLLRAATYRD